MMDSQKCPICKKRPIQPINLKCDHHPCFACASKIMVLDSQNQLQTKYKIVCPTCKKKTVTYDIRYLIISMTQQNEDMYVTAKYINKKPEVNIRRDNNNHIEQRGTQSFGHSKKNSIQSIITNNTSSSKSMVQIECRLHQGYWLQYFCYDCHKKNSKHVFLCGQCFKKHKEQHKHKVLTVKQGLEKVLTHNRNKVQSGIPSRKKELDKMNDSWSIYQETMNSQYEKIYKQLNEEFKNIHKILNEKYESIRKSLKNHFLKQCDEIKNNIEINKKLKQSFKSLQKMQNCSEDAQSQVNFYIYFRQIEDAINSNSLKINKNFELPRLAKRTTLLHQVLNQFLEIEYSSESSRPIDNSLLEVPKSHYRNLSYGNSPMASMKYIGFTGQKADKYDSTKKTNNIGSIDESFKIGKQNYNIKAMTPKSGLCFDFNKLTL